LVTKGEFPPDRKVKEPTDRFLRVDFRQLKRLFPDKVGLVGVIFWIPIDSSEEAPHFLLG